MKKIFITQRIDWIESHKEYRDSVDQRLISLVLESGFIPIPVPNFDREKNSESMALSNFISEIRPEGVILSGGNDIGQYPDRDRVEMDLLAFAKKNSIPVLGICRGMQILGVENGCKLIKVNGHSNTTHRVSGAINGIVNSYHNFSLESCPTDYDVTAMSEDGKIEAIAHKTLRVEGWMWHPERLAATNEDVVKEIHRIFGNEATFA